ncbi:hypothetical protein [Acidaminococcus sp. HCP3S3_G9_1]|uniref:hypothetical protein n=1 Tax=Acidaminococcus sp. HCP3S3_G9_1 TaxID=3438732 RepID=UPI003F8E8CB0
MLVVKKKSIFAVTGRETMNVNAKQQSDYKGNIPDNIKLYYQLLWVAAVLQPIAFAFSNWARVVVYFSISLVVLLPEMINQITTGRNYCFRVPFILILSIFMIIWNILQKNNPYQFMVF